MAGKNNETGLFCNTTSPLYNLNQQGYANVLYNQRLSETPSTRILGGIVNHTNVSNTNNIFTTPSTPVNLEKDTNINKILIKQSKTSLLQKNFAFVRALKQLQKQQQQLLPQQQAFSIHEKTFANFTAKHLCWSFFLIRLKASGLQLCSKETSAQVFFCELCEIFQHIFLQNTLDNYFCQRRSSIFKPNYSSKCTLLEEQLVDRSCGLIFSYSI